MHDHRLPSLSQPEHDVTLRAPLGLREPFAAKPTSAPCDLFGLRDRSDIIIVTITIFDVNTLANLKSCFMPYLMPFALFRSTISMSNSWALAC